MLKAVLIGNLGGDPDMRYSPDGRPFLRFNVACNYRARSPEGEWQDKTEWVRVTVFGQQAERLSQYLRKGSRVYVDGRLEARPWTDQQQQVRAGLEVIANDVQFMSSRADDERMGGEGGGAYSGGARDGGAAAGSGGPARAGGGRAPAEPVDEGDLEDLPF
ncbi:MAG: single-stranded DNA-binding protein [Chloroflexota bacterium]|nr:single-stranded DNA-binding protein [Chloroflexota bacterium]